MSDTSGLSGRQRWIDALKGLMVLVVVAKHSVIWVWAASGVTPDWGGMFLTASIYTNMPVMFLLAGLVGARAVRGDLRRFVDTRVRAVLHPFLLWSVLLAAALGTPTPGGVLHLLVDPWHDAYWFFAVLVLVLVVAVLTRRLPAWSVAAGAGAFAVVLVAVWGAWGPPGAGDLPVPQPMRIAFGAFFFLGTALAGSPSVRGAVIGRWRAALWTAGIVAVGTGIAVAAGVPVQVLRDRVLVVPLLLVVALLLLAVAPRVLRRSAVLEWFGRSSVVVYLVHVVALKWSIPWLVSLGLDDLLVSLLAFGGGVAVVSVAIVLRRTVPGVRWLFALPSWPVAARRRTDRTTAGPDVVGARDCGRELAGIR